MLSATPIIGVPVIALNGSPLTDFTVEDAVAGTLYRQKGWDWSAQVGWYLSDYRAPGSEQPDLVVTYTAGYLLPSDDLVTATLSVAAADKSFNDTAAGFPLLAAGDRITTSGFSTANTGTFTVVTRTASKVTVAETLADHVADGDLKAVLVSTLPADLSKGVRELVKAFYAGRARDPEVTDKQVGDLRITYARAQAGDEDCLPRSVTALLRPYQRAA